MKRKRRPPSPAEAKAWSEKRLRRLRERREDEQSIDAAALIRGPEERLGVDIEALEQDELWQAWEALQRAFDEWVRTKPGSKDERRARAAHERAEARLRELEARDPEHAKAVSQYRGEIENLRDTDWWALGKNMRRKFWRTVVDASGRKRVKATAPEREPKNVGGGRAGKRRRAGKVPSGPSGRAMPYGAGEGMEAGGSGVRLTRGSGRLLIPWPSDKEMGLGAGKSNARRCQAPAKGAAGKRGELCGNIFVPVRADAKYCSNTCKQRANYHARKAREKT